MELQNLANQTPGFRDNVQMQQDQIDIANTVYNHNGRQGNYQMKYQNPINSVDYNVQGPEATPLVRVFRDAGPGDYPNEAEIEADT